MSLIRQISISKTILLVIAAGIISLVIVGVYFISNGGVIVPLKSRFACEIQPDPTGKNDVYAVTYQNDRERKTWLKLVRSFGDGWTPNKRCESIAQRLEELRKKGLTQLTYRTDPATPRQYVICAITKQNHDGCELLITLMPEDEPDKTLSEMADALLLKNITSGIYQGSDGESASNKIDSSKPLVIDLTNHLANEDKNSGI